MKIIAVTQKGPKKAENEDRIIAGQSIIAEGWFQAEIPAGIVAIADGVGGNNAGAVASHFVARRLTTETDITAEGLADINRELLELSRAKPAWADMATTLSGLFITRDSARLFSIGNTRVYLIQSGQYLKQLTSDDTTVQYLLATGQLSAEEAADYGRKNEITACFGGGNPRLFRLKCASMALPASPFLLTSDGVHDYVSIDQMEDVIAAHGLTAEACRVLLTLARASGSNDDASIVLGVMNG